MSGSSDVGYKVSSQPAEGLCVCAQTPTRCNAGFKGCGLDSLAQTFSSFSRSLTHVSMHARTRMHTHAELPNRNTQRAVSWTLSLGFGWREAQFSTPVFGAVIRGLFYFQAASGSHTCAVKYTERALMNSVRPAAFAGQQMKSVSDSGKLSIVCKYTHISSSRPFKSSSELVHASL